MRRRLRERLAAVLAVSTMLSLAGACGVPSSSDPVVDGNVSGHGIGIGAAPHPLPPGPDGFTTVDAFMVAYFQAIAGQTDPESGAARTAVTAFMTAAAGKRWTPSRKITVVRQIGGYHTTPGIRAQVDGKFQVVGSFSPAEGTLEPPPAGTPDTVSLTFYLTGMPSDGVSGSATTGLRIDGASEDGTFMSETALVGYYEPHSVYFWDSEGKGLIPELRYVPRTVSSVQRETMVVNWVLAGPSDALGAAAIRVVNTTLLDPQVQEENGRVIVDVASSHGFLADDQRRLSNQLRWSLIGLGPDADSVGPPPVEIDVDRQQQLIDDQPSFRAANLAADRPDGVPFAIGKGVARPLEGAQVAILNSPTNSSVKFAAINHGETQAALVRTGANGNSELWIRRGADKAHEFVKTLTATSMTRPVWITAADGPMLAIVADGRLEFIDARGGVHQAEAAGIGSIKAMSVAPEGRRIALVTGKGALYVSALTWQGRVPSLVSPRQLRTRLTSASAVAWSRVDQLAVAGWDGDDSKLVEVNSDGTQQTPLAESFGRAAITQVVAYPYDPLDRVTAGPIMFQTVNGPRRVRPAEESAALTWGKGVPPDVGAPSSPFFLD